MAAKILPSVLMIRSRNEKVSFMQNEAQLDLLRRIDPSALCIVPEDRSLYYAMKRVMDIVIALTLLVVLSPLMLLIAVAILLYSPGPVFFVQERVGAKRQLRGKYTYWQKTTFPCYKFRTMRINADPSIHKAYIPLRSLSTLDRPSATARLRFGSLAAPVAPPRLPIRITIMRLNW